MNKSVYIESTIPSYLTAWRSPDLIMAANQEATRAWWDNARHRYDIYISYIVIQETCAGNIEAAMRRLAIIEGMPELDISAEVETLAVKLLEKSAVPDRAKTDAIHISVAAVHGIDFLLTWNCRHIANASMRPLIESVCRAAGYEPPVICTPMELMEE